MPVHFHVLGSGSAGNSSLLEIDGFGLLIDLGFGPRTLAGRLAVTPPLWDRINAVLLTHIHGDHWNENTLKRMAQRRIPLYCHAEHAGFLREWSRAFEVLWAEGLVYYYESGVVIALGPGCRCEPVPLSHDGGETFGFRIEGPRDLFGQCWALSYAADLGCWDAALAGRLADVDLLALEFNHDVAMQYQSGRSPDLIRRVLGDRGHLSNVQAAALVAHVLKLSEAGRLRHLVQLHLSRECNLPELAHAEARTVIDEAGTAVQIHTTCQDAAGPSLVLDETQFAGKRLKFARSRV